MPSLQSIVLYSALAAILAAAPAVFAQNPAHAQDTAPADPAPAPAAASPDAPVDAVAPQFMPVFPLGLDDAAAPLLLPLYSNLPLGRPHPGVKRAVIMVHGILRDASTAYARALTYAGAAAGERGDTILLAPQFLSASDIMRFAAHLPDGGKSIAYWQADGWLLGDDSASKTGTRPVSSFTALDILLAYLAEKDFFPDLQQATIAGFADGAVFVQTYAAASRAPDLLESVMVETRFLVAGAPHYLYMTGVRPKEQTDAKESAGKQATAPESVGFTRPELTICPGYDHYPFGMERLNDYMRQQGASQVRLRYPTRRVHYIAPAAPLPSATVIDRSCAARLQGDDIAARARNYFSYLQTIYGPVARSLQRLHVIEGAGWDAAALLGSACGNAILLGDGVCETGLIGTFGPPGEMPKDRENGE